MNVVVGSTPAFPDRAASAAAASKRERTTQVPPDIRVPAAKRMDTEWYIGEQTRCTSPGPKSQRSASSRNAAAAVGWSQMPVHTPLARPVVPEV
jgi:hypothetical protein